MQKSFIRRFSDIAHKQVDAGYSRKYAENWERIFGKAKGGKEPVKEKK